MTSFLLVFALTFGAILLVELPDKTLVATLVLSTRYPRRPVLIGVSLAFAVQCLIAVTAGGLLRLLPGQVVEGIVAALFAVGAVLLLREGFSSEDAEADDDGQTPTEVLSSRRVATISFGVLFAAEWGDASQLATAGLVARYGEPVAVGLGAFLALVGVASIATVLGKVILRKVPLHWIQRIAGFLFAAFAVFAAVTAARG
ncbi:MAG: putative integral rane protein [Pseudonocardiales bacterium]|nr:putative integral rane protein [Pseudonocardiales bacterium]